MMALEIHSLVDWLIDLMETNIGNVGDIVQNSTLRSAAVLSLCKFMCTSATFWYGSAWYAK